jgi:ligand-binding sensor domain-containing protein
MIYRRWLLAAVVFFLIFLPHPGKANLLLDDFTTEVDHYAKFIDFNTFFAQPPGYVYQMYQDNYGYIWFATQNGLARFDGNSVKHYYKDWTPNALPSSHVTTLEQDHSGRLWVGTAGGLCLYDYGLDHFIPVLVGDTTLDAIDDYHVRAVYVDGDSLLWVDMLSGLLHKIDIAFLKLIQTYQHVSTHQPYYPYSGIIRDSTGKIWVGGRNFGPFRLEEQNGRFIYRPVGDPDLPGYQDEYDAAYFHTDKNQNLWMGRVSGVYKYDYEREIFIKVFGSSSWAFSEAKDGTLWFGAGSGLLRYGEKKQKRFYPFNEENPHALKGDFILDVMADNRNNVWISTSHGVMVLKASGNSVRRLFHIPGMEETPASSAVTDLAQDKRGYVWISTKNKGIDRYHPQTGKIAHFNSQNTTGMVSDNIPCLTLTEEGEIYAGMWAGKGFGKLFPDERMFYTFTYDPANTRSDWYNDLVFDAEGNMYLGFWGGPGLTLFDTATNTFGQSLHTKFYDAFKSRLITDLQYSSSGDIWAATTQTGLHCYSPKADTVFSFLAENKENGIEDRHIHTVTEDSSGNIWVGAEGLYYSAQPEAGFLQVEMPELLQNPEIYRILVQSADRVWLLTNHGLIKYKPSESRFESFAQIADLQFLPGNAAILELQSGELMIGGVNGIVVLDTEMTMIQNPFLEVYITSVSVYDKIKVANLELADKVRLKHNENFISIGVGSSHWGNEDPYRYYYMLEGFNRNWMTMENKQRETRFTNIPPGDYLFKVKVVNPDGEALENAAVMDLQVIPAVWQTWWFLPGIMLMTALLVAFVWWNRMRSLKLSLANSELSQKLLRLQMNPHFIFNSLFAIQSFIYSKKTHLAGDYLSDFAKLIRLILDNSRFEFIPFEKEYETVSLYLKLQQLRFNDAFSYHVDYDAELIHQDYSIPPMLAQPFLENAIEHGIKKLEKPGIIQISYTLHQNLIQVKVQDNGIGLTAAAEKKKHTGGSHESVAIALCKKRLKTLNRKKQGQIGFKIEEIKSKEGRVEGTVVQLNIPVTEKNNAFHH